LGLGDFRQTADGFQFDDHLSFDKNIQPLSLDYIIFVNNIDFNLALKFDLPQVKFMAEGFFVNGFQKTGPE